MRVSAEDWADLISMTKAAILTWQDTADARGLQDKFVIHNATKEGRSALLTKHNVNGIEVKAQCVMRFEATGSIFRCRFDRTRKRWVAKPAPQSWISYNGAPIEVIWKALKLADFAPLKEMESAR